MLTSLSIDSDGDILVPVWVVGLSMAFRRRQRRIILLLLKLVRSNLLLSDVAPLKRLSMKAGGGGGGGRLNLGGLPARRHCKHFKSCPSISFIFVFDFLVYI
jgi:hypothetical protein